MRFGIVRISILAVMVAVLLVGCRKAQEASTAQPPVNASANVAPPPPPPEIVVEMPSAGLPDGALVKGSESVVYIWRAGALHPIKTRSSPAGMQNGMQVLPDGWVDLTYLGVSPTSVMRLPDEALENLRKGEEMEGSNPPAKQ